MVDLLNRSTGRLGVSSEALQRMIEERQRNPGGFLANLAQQARDEPLETASASGIPVVSDLADARLAGRSIGKAWREPSKVNLLDASANVGLAALPFVGIGAIKAFHGSPHSFDKFDLSKIGTGEGAQAYGHGLYFAENEGVAREYQKMTSNMPNKGADSIAQYWVSVSDGDKAVARQELQRSIDAWDRNPMVKRDPELQKMQADNREALDLIDRVGAEKGNLYDVNLDVNHEDLLDWDLPLSKQPPKVREALGKAYPERVWPDGSPMPPPFQDRWSGHETYADLVDRLGSQAAASKALREAGLPGIRYLDAGSRGGGEGSRNVVLFDDQLAEILRRR